ncbi:MAG: ROK family protein [Gemmataceae bacterium]|nr:ROK family protein [Gemmataceae bacterium]
MFLGIEIGGTKLQLGVGRGDGVLAGLWRATVEPKHGADGIRRQIIRGVPELLEQSRIERGQLRGVGIGFGGPVDDATRTVVKSHQIEGWDNFPLADWIGELVGLPAALGNDADVAGLAEALFGAGKGLSPIFYITIGSGIGGGLIVNGAIYRGCGRGAAEIGHLRVPVVQDGALGYLPLEQIASGWGIQEWARREMVKSSRAFAHWAGVQGDAPALTAHVVAEAAAAGDEAAWCILYHAWEKLAEAICQVIALCCPRRIVIGGGVSLMGEALLFEPLRKLVAERVFKPFANCCAIVPAALGEEVVVHGSLALARQRINIP